MFGTCKEKCKKWLLSHHPEAFPGYYPNDVAALSKESTEETLESNTKNLDGLDINETDEEKKRQSRGTIDFY